MTWDPSDISPRAFWRGLRRWSLVIIFVLVLGITASVAAWRGWWWFANHNATLQNEQIQNSVSNQRTLADQITSKLADVAQETVQIAANPSLAGPIKAQRAAEASEVCSDAADITGVPLPASQRAWVARNCELGLLSTTSPLYVIGAP